MASSLCLGLICAGISTAHKYGESGVAMPTFCTMQARTHLVAVSVNKAFLPKEAPSHKNQIM